IFPRLLQGGDIPPRARVGNGVERPAQGSGAHIEGSNVSWRRGMGFRVCSAYDDQIFVYASRRGQLDGLLLMGLAQSFAQVDSSLLTETGNHLAGDGIESVEIIAGPGKDAALMAVGPIRDAAAQHSSFEIEIEFPNQLSSSGIEGDHTAARRGGVEDLSYDDGIRLKATRFSSVILPGYDQFFHVIAIDLRQAGVMSPIVSTVGRPVLLRLCRERATETKAQPHTYRCPEHPHVNSPPRLIA